MSLGIVLTPTSHLTQEERRNKILRQRYGSAGSKSRSPSSFLNEKLHVVGQAVNVRTSVYISHDAMKSHRFSLTSACKDSNRDIIGNSNRIMRYSNTSPTERNSLGSFAPPSTPYGISVSASSNESNQFHDSGDLSSNCCIKQSINKSGSRGDLEADYGSGKIPDKQQQESKLEPGFKYEMYKRQPPKKKLDHSKPWLASNKSKSSVVSLPASKSSHKTLTGNIKHAQSESATLTPKTRRRLSYTTSSSGSKVRIRKGFKKKSAIEIKDNLEHIELFNTLNEMERDMESAAIIRKFRNMPKSKPYVVCFDYPGVNLCHADVKRAIENVIPNSFKSSTVVSIQFENQNVKLRTCGKENRWLIKFLDLKSRNKIIKSGLDIFEREKQITTRKSRDNLSKSPINSKHVDVMLLDTVLLDEYELYLRRINAGEKLNSLKLLCAGSGHKLLSKLL